MDLSPGIRISPESAFELRALAGLGSAEWDMDWVNRKESCCFEWGWQVLAFLTQLACAVISQIQ